MSEACRQIGVTDNTYYRWRKEYGGIRSDQEKRLKELDRENARLKKLVVEAELNTDPAYLQLRPEDEKNREGNAVPLRADLVDDLHDWLALKLQIIQEECATTSKPIPAGQPPDQPLFYVSNKLLQILNRAL